EAAAQAAAEAVKALPEPPILRVRLGKALLAAGRRVEAAAALREALARNPNLRDARDALAEAERVAGDAPPARAAEDGAVAGRIAARRPGPAGRKRADIEQPPPAQGAADAGAVQRLRQAVARDPSDEAAH